LGKRGQPRRDRAKCKREREQVAFGEKAERAGDVVTGSGSGAATKVRLALVRPGRQERKAKRVKRNGNALSATDEELVETGGKSAVGLRISGD